MVKSLIAGILALCLVKGVCAAEPSTVPSDARQQVGVELARMDDGLKQAAERLGKTGLREEKRFILIDLGVHVLDVARVFLGEEDAGAYSATRRNGTPTVAAPLMSPMTPDAASAGMKTIFGKPVKPETNRSAGLR